METEAFFDPRTSTVTYVVYDRENGVGVVIDPVMDYDPTDSTCSLDSVLKIVDFVRKKGLSIHYILETHAHADHLTGGQELKKIFPDSRMAMGREIQTVQKTFKKIFNFDDRFETDGGQFDLLIDHGESLRAGPLHFTAIHTPGHTPACYSYHISDAVFVGDTLFMPDSGVARCDFPGGDAAVLFDSVTERLYRLPDHTKIFTAHDYQPGGRELVYQSTIGESKRSNIHINSGTRKEDFVRFRTGRDETLPSPRLLLPSIQVNINAGILPTPEDNRVSYLKIPLNKKRLE